MILRCLLLLAIFKYCKEVVLYTVTFDKVTLKFLTCRNTQCSNIADRFDKALTGHSPLSSYVCQFKHGEKRTF